MANPESRNKIKRNAVAGVLVASALGAIVFDVYTSSSHESVPEVGAKYTPASPKPTVKTNKNVEKSFTYLDDTVGMTSVATAAIVGTAYAESHVDPASEAVNADGHGLLMWGDAGWVKLVSFARTNHENPVALNTQLDYLVHDMKTTDNGALYDELQTQTNVDDATQLFISEYTRPAYTDYVARMTYAEEAYDAFK